MNKPLNLFRLMTAQFEIGASNVSQTCAIFVLFRDYFEMLDMLTNRRFLLNNNKPEKFLLLAWNLAHDNKNGINDDRNETYYSGLQ